MSNSDSDADADFPDDLDRFAIDDPEPMNVQPSVGETPPVSSVDVTDEMEARAGDTSSTDHSGGESNEDTASHSQLGFIVDGLSQTEMIALVGITVSSYALAWGVLTVMLEHGLNSVPITLWAVFGLLVLAPVTILFGTEIIHLAIRSAGR